MATIIEIDDRQIDLATARANDLDRFVNVLSENQAGPGFSRGFNRLFFDINIFGQQQNKVCFNF